MGHPLMQLDKTGVDFMKTNEGTNIVNGKHVAYQDEVGKWTIGYGETSGVHQGMVWTQAQADADFKKVADGYYGACVNKFITRPMTQNQYNAMVDITYNIGISNEPSHPGFPQSKICKLFNQGKTKEAGQAFFGWLRPASLYSRRVKEVKLFNTASSTPPPKTVNNQDAVNKANAKKALDAKNQKAIGDAMHQQDLKDEKSDNDAIAKAKLTRDANALKTAQTKAKANALIRANAKKVADANKAKIAKDNKTRLDNSYKQNNPVKNSISQPKDATNKNVIIPTKTNKGVLKSSIPIIGLLIGILIMENVEIPETTLE